MEIPLAIQRTNFSETKLELRKATSLPSVVYTSDRVFSLELERIFYKKWLVICHESQFQKSGDVLVKNVGKKSILVMKGDDGELRAFHNVCRHRGARLVTESGSSRVIQCPYHAWTYKLDGSLIGCPDMDTYFAETGFEKRDYPLYPVKLEKWGGFVWINLDPNSESLRSYLGDFSARFEKYETERLRWVTSQGHYDVECNWKTMLENFNECYHCPAVHPETLKQFYRDFKPADSSQIRGPYVMLQWKDCPWDGAPLYSQKRDDLNLSDEERQMQWLPLVFPNFQFTFTPNWVMTVAAWPESPGKLKLDIEIYAYPWSASDDYSEMVRVQDMVTKQDIKIVKLQHEGLQSGVFDGCKFNSLEESIYSIQKMYVDAMGEVELSP